MHWGHIFFVVFKLYLAGFGAAFCYSMSATAVGEGKAATPSKLERAWAYAVALFWLAVVSFALGAQSYSEDGDDATKTDFNSTAIVFLAMLAPVLAGVAKGLSKDYEKQKKSSWWHSDD